MAQRVKPKKAAAAGAGARGAVGETAPAPRKSVARSGKPQPAAETKPKPPDEKPAASRPAKGAPARAAEKPAARPAGRLKPAAPMVAAMVPGRDRLAEVEAECARLRAELATASEEIERLRQRQELVVNRIDWVIDSLHNLIEGEG